MSTVTRLPRREQEILDKMRARPRLEGRHMTDSIVCNIKSWAQARLGAVGEAAQHSDGTLIRFLTGLGMEYVLMEGHDSQVQTLSANDDSVGTIDIWKGYPVEVKVTWQSSRRPVEDNDHWLLQLAGYAARNLKDDQKTMRGELWVVHLSGDYGVKRCPNGHERDEVDYKRKHEESGRPRLACRECDEFLIDGDREPCIRCHEVRWTRAELESLHAILTDRLAQLKDDIENADYAFGAVPPVRWGYQREFECNGCPVKERIGCPGIDGMDGMDDLEGKLKGSILERMEV